MLLPWNNNHLYKSLKNIVKKGTRMKKTSQREDGSCNKTQPKTIVETKNKRTEWSRDECSECCVFGSTKTLGPWPSSSSPRHTGVETYRDKTGYIRYDKNNKNPNGRGERKGYQRGVK